MVSMFDGYVIAVLVIFFAHAYFLRGSGGI